MIREEHLVSVGRVLDDEPDVVLAVTVTAPEATQLTEVPPVFFCVPGGGLNRGYYDLRTGGGTRFSFAAQMAGRGGITVAIDPLGIGDSTRPSRGFELTPDVHAAALARLHDAICAALRAGNLTPSLPPLPRLRSIGVGHSVGALLLLFQQDTWRSYDALALLGFGTGGMPAALDEELRGYAGDPARVRANVVRLTERRYADPYPVLAVGGRGREIYGGGADLDALATMRGCRAPLLATVAVFVIIPGSSAPEEARVDVPVLLAAGDNDLCGPVPELVASFGLSPAVSVVELPATGHSHFAFPSVDELFPRLAAWAASLRKEHTTARGEGRKSAQVRA
jgi:pimeloyl-ACP methyl ester carboxylesterase